MYRLQIRKNGIWSHYGLPFEDFANACRKARDLRSGGLDLLYALRVIRVYSVRGSFSVLTEI